MAKLTAAELSKKLQTAFPDDTSDSLLEIMGDIADSVGDMDFSAERAEYEKKLQAKDSEWKQKFIYSRYPFFKNAKRLLNVADFTLTRAIRLSSAPIK